MICFFCINSEYEYKFDIRIKITPKYLILRLGSMTVPLIVIIGKLLTFLGIFNNLDFEVFGDSLLS